MKAGIDFGKNLCLARATDGTKRYEVARKCGISQKTIGFAEDGVRDISCEYAIRLAQYYRVPLSQLSGYIPESHNKKGLKWVMVKKQEQDIPIDQFHIDHFALVLNALFAKYGISAQTLSNRTGIARGTLNAYRIGTRYPSFNNVLVIANAFHVSCDWMLLPLEGNLLFQE